MFPQQSFPRAQSSALNAVLWTVAVLAVAGSAAADARSEFLVRALRTSPMFRVRTQAAISLGGVESEPQIVEALAAALTDEHPAVRAAAASALERVGDPSALPALRRASADSEGTVQAAAQRAVQRLEAVARSQPRSRPVPDAETVALEPPAPSGPARFYVAVGRPGSNVSSVSRETLDALRTFIARQVAVNAGVRIAPEDESAPSAQRALREENLTGYFLDSSIVVLEELQEGGVRARVSVVVQSYPERNIRSMLSGAATVTAGRGPAVEQQALEGALRSALRGLSGVMEAAATVQASAPRRRRR